MKKMFFNRPLITVTYILDLLKLEYEMRYISDIPYFIRIKEFNLNIYTKNPECKTFNCDFGIGKFPTNNCKESEDVFCKIKRYWIYYNTYKNLLKILPKQLNNNILAEDIAKYTILNLIN